MWCQQNRDCPHSWFSNRWISSIFCAEVSTPTNGFRSLSIWEVNVTSKKLNQTKKWAFILRFVDPSMWSGNTVSKTAASLYVYFFIFLKKIIVFYKIQNTQRKKFKNILLKIGQSAKWVFIKLNFDVSGMNFYCVTIYSMKSFDWISVVQADGQSI